MDKLKQYAEQQWISLWKLIIAMWFNPYTLYALKHKKWINYGSIKKIIKYVNLDDCITLYPAVAGNNS